MSARRCSRHAESEALYRCDGCGRLLCDDCIEVGHRLLFCVWCRERALPLEVGDADTAPARERQRAQRRPVSTRDVLLFPLRGQGGFVLWGTVLYLGFLRLLAGIAPSLGIGSIFLGVIVLVLAAALLVMVPGLSFAIVRTTAAGGDEMPDWPDWLDLGERLSECFAVLVLALMALMPAIGLVWLGGCELRLLAVRPACLLLFVVGLGAGAPAWVVATGAVGLLGDMWLSLRWDLHVRALVSMWRPAVAIAAGLVGLYLAGGLAALVLGWLPVLGGLALLVVDTYTWFLGMHLVGLLMRRHEVTVESIYL